jgi:hypothetical protein
MLLHQLLALPLKAPPIHFVTEGIENYMVKEFLMLVMVRVVEIILLVVKSIAVKDTMSNNIMIDM